MRQLGMGQTLVSIVTGEVDRLATSALGTAVSGESAQMHIKLIAWLLLNEISKAQVSMVILNRTAFMNITPAALLPAGQRSSVCVFEGPTF